MNTLCTFCEGQGYTPYIHLDNRVYKINWRSCDVCHKSGYINYRNRGERGERETILIGYIPEDKEMPTIESKLSKHCGRIYT